MSELSQKVEKLLKLPQSLCKGCGQCCYAIFKGGMLYEEVLEIDNRKPESQEEATLSEGAKDFLTIFAPFESVEKAKEYNTGFVERTLKHFNKTEDQVTYFYCRFLDKKNHCKIHEDRPNLCRMYPIPSEHSYFNPGCGYKEQAEKNWKEIKEIIDNLNEREKSLRQGETDGNN